MLTYVTRIPAVLLLCLLCCSCLGCAGSATIAPPAPIPQVIAQAVAPSVTLSDRLVQPAGAATEILPQSTFSITIDNCLGGNPLWQEYRHKVVFTPTYQLSLTDAPSENTQFTDVVQELVQQSYGIALGEPLEIERSLALSVDPGKTTTFMVQWSRLVDHNAISMMAQESRAETVPLEIDYGRALGIVRAVDVTCTEHSNIVIAPITGGETGDDDTTELAPTASPTPQAGTSPATQLVLRHLDALDRGDIDSAYGLLAPTYQASIPLERYRAGYAYLRSVEPRDMVAQPLPDRRTHVTVRIRLGFERQGILQVSDWTAIYLVVDDQTVLDGQLAIESIRMTRLAAEG